MHPLCKVGICGNASISRLIFRRNEYVGLMVPFINPKPLQRPSTITSLGPQPLVLRAGFFRCSSTFRQFETFMQHSSVGPRRGMASAALPPEGSEISPQGSGPQHQHTNRLAQEKSPYLLQHAHNPVSQRGMSHPAYGGRCCPGLMLHAIPETYRLCLVNVSCKGCNAPHSRCMLSYSCHEVACCF